jgi:hypothetical protein
MSVNVPPMSTPICTRYGLPVRGPIVSPLGRRDERVRRRA